MKDQSNDIPPGSGFRRFGLGLPIQRGIDEAGFADPWPIQVRTIPPALEGRDILGLAQTGTGKTAAFALPMIERLSDGRGAGPRGLIIAPTRELAQQIEAEIRVLGRLAGITTLAIYGGVGQRAQVDRLRKRVDVLVACPGRLLDLVGQGLLRLDRVEMLVIDEADRMFDMGFLPDIRRILASLPPARQNLLFSATMPAQIRGLADEVLRSPFVVELEHSAPADTIAHALYPVTETQKVQLLERLISAERFVSGIVFTRTKHRARRLARLLAAGGRRAVALQGNMSQNARDRAMRGFRQGDFDILVATDIAARGIDVEHVSHVINYDVPNVAEAYTHRIGRTGRATRSGEACTFVTGDDLEMVHAIEKMIGAEIPRVHVEGLDRVAMPSSSRGERPGRRAAHGGRGPSADRGALYGTSRSSRKATPGSRRDRSRARRPRRRR